MGKLEEQENKSGNHEARVEKLCTLIRKYRDINEKAIEKLTECSEAEDSFKAYSQMVFSMTSYLEETTQSYHATLNKNKNVIWLCEDSKENPKESLFAKKIGLVDLKAGEFLPKYNEKDPVVARSKKPEPKTEKGKAKKPEKKGKKKDEIDEMEDEME